MNANIIHFIFNKIIYHCVITKEMHNGEKCVCGPVFDVMLTYVKKFIVF